MFVFKFLCEADQAVQGLYLHGVVSQTSNALPDLLSEFNDEQLLNLFLSYLLIKVK